MLNLFKCTYALHIFSLLIYLIKLHEFFFFLQAHAGIFFSSSISCMNFFFGSDTSLPGYLMVHPLHKIFSRNTVKVSYSCMSNVRSIITSHNARIIRRSQSQNINTDNCNRRNTHACPLQNKCMSEDVVYKATVITNNTQDTKHYIGMTSNTFKERYKSHIKSFTHKKDSNETELSKHVSGT